MRKHIKITLITLAVVFGGLFAFNLVKALAMKIFFAHYTPPAVAVSSVVAKETSWQPSLPAVGNFAAIRGIEINADAGGKIVAIHFNSGDMVKEGQALVDIDDSIEQASLQFFEAELTLQKLNFSRQTDLLKRNATAASSVDEARAHLLEAEANVAKTQASIKHKHITAPFAGQLGIRQVSLGDYITSGQTIIVTLQELDNLYLEFALPEQMFPKLYIHQPITFSIEQNPGLLFTGKITAIDAKIDTNTHTIKVQATVPNCPRAAIENPEHSPLVTIKTNTRSDKRLVICNSEQTPEKVHAQQLSFQQGAHERGEGVYMQYMTEAERGLNTAENSSAKSIYAQQLSFVPGMFASIHIEQPVRNKVITVPTTAISYTLYGNSVFVIEPDPNAEPDEDGHEALRVRQVFVTTGEQQGNYTVIKEGIKAGQRIVSSGELKLQNGTRVVINNSVRLLDKTPEQLGQ